MVVAVGGTAAYAFQDVAIATIKMPFMVGNRMMAAGTYEVEVTSDGALLLHSRTTGLDSPLVLAVGRTPSQDSVDDPQLIFDRVGKTLELAQVTIPGEQGYLLVEPSSATSHRSATKPRG